ncbi:MAG: hypothetical protein CL878_07325 [Dehalococcoidia bacterium]|nr:hypothetical protein [Dehalococcoidia bacterium]
MILQHCSHSDRRGCGAADGDNQWLLALNGETLAYLQLLSEASQATSHPRSPVEMASILLNTLVQRIQAGWVTQPGEPTAPSQAAAHDDATEEAS